MRPATAKPTTLQKRSGWSDNVTDLPLGAPVTNVISQHNALAIVRSDGTVHAWSLSEPTQTSGQVKLSRVSHAAFINVSSSHQEQLSERNSTIIFVVSQAVGDPEVNAWELSSCVNLKISDGANETKPRRACEKPFFNDFVSILPRGCSLLFSEGDIIGCVSDDQCTVSLWRCTFSKADFTLSLHMLRDISASEVSLTRILAAVVTPLALWLGGIGGVSVVTTTEEGKITCVEIRDPNRCESSVTGLPGYLLLLHISQICMFLPTMPL